MAWRHQAITGTNVDWSFVQSSDIHIREVSKEMPQPSITKIRMKITYIKFHSNFPEASELMQCFILQDSTMCPQQYALNLQIH